MGDATSRVRMLKCACNNKGVALYVTVGEKRKLADLTGEFQREGDGDDPLIICTFCEAVVTTQASAG